MDKVQKHNCSILIHHRQNPTEIISYSVFDVADYRLLNLLH
jgi:hypothetical protein